MSELLDSLTTGLVPKQVGIEEFAESSEYCNPPDAPLWMADLTFKDIGDVVPGDRVMGWQRQGHNRHLCESEVLDVRRRHAPIVKVTMESGRTFRCTPDHRWLTASNGGSRAVNRGGEWFCHPTVGRKLVHVVDCPDYMMTGDDWRDALWLGGLFDGEGSAGKHAPLSIAQSRKHNPDVCVRIERVLDRFGFHWSYTDRAYLLRSGEASVRTAGVNQASRQMLTDFVNLCQPVRRSGIIAKIMGAGWRTSDRIVEIEPDGEGEVVALTTSTGNYVCNGYASKNCDKPLYPRQTVLLKLIFLEEMTGPEEDVLTEWINGGRYNEILISPNIRERRDYLRDRGYKHFREINFVGGRRSSKGFTTGVAMAKVMWDTLNMGDPHEAYGIARTKEIYFSCVAASESQAKEFQYSDFVGTVEGCRAFDPYLQKSLETEFRVATPSDLRAISAAKARGGKIQRDIAKLRGKALAANAGTLRGSATMCITIDEMAHMTVGESKASAEQVYCLDPETKVLGSDLHWRPIKDLRPGSMVVSMDENPPAPGQRRKMREAMVQAVRPSRSAPVRITFEDGTHVTCSDNHRWLTKRGNEWRWTFSGERHGYVGENGHALTHLRVGDEVRHVVDPWKPDHSRHGGWLAGILDGEGYVYAYPRRGIKVGIAQNRGRVYDQAWRALEERGFEPVATKCGLTCSAIEVKGMGETMRLLGSLQPVRLDSKKLWEGREHRDSALGKRIAKIERLPEQDLIDIQTTTGTFLAEGFVSHNTAAVPSLNQFALDGMMFLNSSPYTKVGKFYEIFETGMRPFVVVGQYAAPGEENGQSDPRMFTFEFPSWALFEGYRKHKSRWKQRERGREFGKMITVSPDWDPDEVDENGDPLYSNEDKLGIGSQRVEEQKNPEAFKVEQRGKFAEVIDAYLNPALVDKMYSGLPIGHDPLPDGGFKPLYGPLYTNHGQAVSNLYRYKFHVDPSSTTAGFGFAIAHIEYIMDPLIGEEVEHVIFDLIKRWDPKQFGGVIRWGPIRQEIQTYAEIFRPFEITFDQHQSLEPIQLLQEQLTRRNVVCQVYEKTATNELNWKRWEVLKTAIYQGLVHAPGDEHVNVSPWGGSGFTSREELKFLQQLPTGGKFAKIEKQDIGPVRTKDMADCIAECVNTLIGNLMTNRMRDRLSHSAQFGGMGGYGVGQGGPVGGPGPPGISGYYSTRHERMAASGMDRSSLTRSAIGGRRAFRSSRSRGR